MQLRHAEATMQSLQSVDQIPSGSCFNLQYFPMNTVLHTMAFFLCVILYVCSILLNFCSLFSSCTPAITTKLSSALGDAGNDGTTLTVHWSSIEDATGYVVMATSYIGKQRNETVTRVVFGPADGTGNQELRVSIPFNIECSDKFKFKVAAFNSFGMGLYTDEVEVRPQETCDSFSCE